MSGDLFDRGKAYENNKTTSHINMLQRSNDER